MWLSASWAGGLGKLRDIRRHRVGSKTFGSIRSRPPGTVATTRLHHPEREDDGRRLLRSNREPGQIKDAQGRVVYDADMYTTATAGDPPDTVNPSFWRQSQLTAIQGLFEVTEGIYQIRGIELSNMTVIEGNTGVIIIDPAVSAEIAEAGLGLYRRHRGDRPVAGVIFTHSHLDHFGGVLGVADADTDVPIIAPEGFLQHAVSENVYAGTAMMRRTVYHTGAALPVGAKGTLGVGLGPGTSQGRRQPCTPVDAPTRGGRHALR